MSQPTAELARFGSNVSERLRSAREELPDGPVFLLL